MFTKIIIHGQPITKKNSQTPVEIGKRCPCCKRGERTIPIPSKPFKAYEKLAKEQLRLTSRRYTGSVEVCCHYYLQTARRPDLSNLMAATHDILQSAGVIDDDKNIISVDGSRIMGVDRQNPRVEIEIKKAPD